MNILLTLNKSIVINADFKRVKDLVVILLTLNKSKI